MRVTPTDPTPAAGLTKAEARHAREPFEQLFAELTAIGLHADGSTTRVPTAMLFVRSATGASHSQRELASVEDCQVGIGALTAMLAALAADSQTPTR
jgi:hypothetical protein